MYLVLDYDHLRDLGHCEVEPMTFVRLFMVVMVALCMTVATMDFLVGEIEKAQYFVLLSILFQQFLLAERRR